MSTATGPFLEKRNKRDFQVGIAPGVLIVDEADHNHIRLHIIALAMNDTGKVLNDLTQQVDLHPTAEGLQRIQPGIQSNPFVTVFHMAAVDAQGSQAFR